MFTEVSAVNGTAYAIVIIAFSAFLSVLVSTGNLRVSLIVISTVLCILAFTLAVFALAGWTVGIVEAVAISILLGSSVDYSLHVAEAFIESSHENEAAGFKLDKDDLVTVTLTKIGVSVLHAAITTFLAVVCLLFCDSAIFVKFGQILAVSVCASITCALFLLPSLLLRFGPTRYLRSFKKQAFTLGVVVGVMLGVYGLCFLLHVTGIAQVPGPNGGPLFES